MAARRMDPGVDPIGGTMPMPQVDFAFPQAPPSIIERMESGANYGLQAAAPAIRPIARLFLLSTFLEDAVRMATQWDTQVNHINTEWESEPWVGTTFVWCNLIFQVLPSFLILLNGVVKMPNWIIVSSLVTLVVVVLAQSVAYHVLWNVEFFFRNLAVIGALCLVGAEAVEPEPTKGGLLDRDVSLDEEEAEVADVLRLSGRLLLVLMFVTLTKFDNVTRIITELIGMLLLALLVIGFKTRLSAVTLFVLLMVENLTLNDFFMHDSTDPMHDLKKFNFFQALTVTGGLMMLVALGPGAVSLDGEDKKNL
eukprot:CAMPEP_0182916170 /NCGR_PEP_ID=MMETSP0105_2-20130417/779_1 /TAXON_ID=81532 ORGANISM="Acanthoeca-like sp., Strain 10tr" /NCGR_SAMPLE_ID=MMETSP0105_2 /ASSEMBLY_ACC=CAM_ASM_000205 /LENGTH=308 /DNA_ID=CAMNT_0025053099 /DNA_START=54 /DNA_END=980 /DNA_ORIENTATION=+